MRDLFPGWVPPDEQTLDQYWENATFAVDTSVFLDLYRFSEETRKGLLEALRSFGERLWIPHQVGLEFHRNRLGVLLDQREAESNLLRELNALRQSLDKQLSELLRRAGRRDLAPHRKAIDDGFDSLKEKLQKAEQEHTKGLGDSIRDDPIYDEVVALCQGRVGLPLDEGRWVEVVKDAEERFREGTPPGYLDKDKEDDAKYGDVVLWHQLCDRAAETRKPVVFITDDRKTDWVWEIRGKTIGPRPELVAEMNAHAAVGFHLYTPTRFLQMWKQRESGQDVEPEVLAEIEGSGSVDLDDLETSIYERLLREFMGDAGDEPEKRLLLNSLRNSRSPRASHTIGPGGVALLLEYPPGENPQSTPRVTITTPKGERVLFSNNPTLAGGLSQGVRFYVQYPSDFPGAGDIEPGRYNVTWEEVVLSGNPEQLVASVKSIAADAFTISAFEA